ncbi:hypothetical protein ACIBCH_09680 [Amycolatopsis thailandensis]|uniref:hypothetical protein n=1 Tax=Amycolatopsis thailandensis TaxID=589330 RepID=UPI00379B49E8
MSEISRKLLKLALFFDEHPEFDEFPELFADVDAYFCQHLVGEQAGRLDGFAERFGATVKHRITNADGMRYSKVEVRMNGRLFVLQCRTEDYEAATGKTVGSAVTS